MKKAAKMPTLLDFVPMLVRQQAGGQRLERIPEPNAVMEAPQSVLQYDRVLTTKLVLYYAVGLEIIHRARSQSDRGELAIDLCCGPGHFTAMLHQHLGYQHVRGLDVSQPMVDTGNKNAALQGVSRQVTFDKADVTQLQDVPQGRYDLSCFADASHHMPDLTTVYHVLREMDRITKPSGLVMVMDLARLRTDTLTEQYVNVIGQDYVQRGLDEFFEDFRTSMYAAWTPGELRTAIPHDTDRYWCHIVPHGLPTIQVILGLPLGRKKPFVRSGFPWPDGKNPVPPEMRWEWKMLRRTLLFASRHWIQQPRG